MATIYECDRCHKRVKSMPGDAPGENPLIKISASGYAMPTYEFCEQCKQALIKFITDGVSEIVR